MVLVVVLNAVNFSKHMRLRLLRQLEDHAWVCAQPGRDVVDGQTALVHRIQQHAHGVVRADRRRGLVAHLGRKLPRHGAHRESINVLDVVPKRGLVLCRRQARRHGIHVVREEERVHRHIARDTQPLGLRKRDELHVVGATHIRHMERAVVQAGQQEHRRKICATSIREDELVFRPVGEVVRHVRGPQAVLAGRARV